MSVQRTGLLQAAVAQLSAGQSALALDLLDRALAAGLEPALEPRARSLRAQALQGLDRLDEALVEVDAAIRQARALGDGPGLRQLRGLSGPIRGAIAAREEQRRRDRIAAETPLRALLDPAETPLERAMVLLKKSGAELEAGRVAASVFLAQRALELARAQPESSREQVYALLALVRAEPSRADDRLHRALRVADEADNQAMITAVAQAARAAGVVFAPHTF